MVAGRARTPRRDTFNAVSGLARSTLSAWEAPSAQRNAQQEDHRRPDERGEAPRQLGVPTVYHTMVDAKAGTLAPIKEVARAREESRRRANIARCKSARGDALGVGTLPVPRTSSLWSQPGQTQLNPPGTSKFGSSATSRAGGIELRPNLSLAGPMLATSGTIPIWRLRARFSKSTDNRTSLGASWVSALHSERQAASSP